MFQKFHPHTIIIGYDHRFGKNRQGDYHLLEEYAQKLNFKILEIPEKILNSVTISSTQIREALLKGEVETANAYLGYTYFFEGEVVHGEKLGRQLGYPTANLYVESKEKLIPANGIYVVEAAIIDNENKGYHKRLQAVMSIGLRPTVGGNTRTIEVHIFNFDDDIYGKQMQVFVHRFLRKEVKFDTIEELIQQMEGDKQQSLNYFIHATNRE